MFTFSSSLKKGLVEGKGKGGKKREGRREGGKKGRREGGRVKEGERKGVHNLIFDFHLPF
jgi:hypothetical protein